jgi:hypothetical protein
MKKFIAILLAFGFASSTALASGAFGNNPLLQNPLWWFGTPNPNPPAPIYQRTFEPLTNLPGWVSGPYSWVRENPWGTTLLLGFVYLATEDSTDSNTSNGTGGTGGSGGAGGTGN